MKLPISILLLSGAMAFGVNLIPNSGFETGANRGVLEYGTSGDTFGGNGFSGNISFLTGQLTNDAFQGRYAMTVIGPLVGRAVWLTNGTYEFSCYAKSPAGLAGPYYFGMMNWDDLVNVVAPPTNYNVGSTYTRLTSTFVATSNGFYWPKFIHNQTLLFVDNLQLEPGTSVSAYAPQAVVELGLSTSGTNNLYFSGDSPTFNLDFWNTGTASNVTAQYQVFDLWNSTVLSNTVSVSLAAATNTRSVVSMPSRTGWFRIKSRLSTANDSDDEMTMIVYPYASNITTSATTDFLGGHPHDSDFHLRRELLVNRKFGRLLSPNYQALRWDYIEPTRGNLTFYDYSITNTLASGINIIAPLTPSDGNWPLWATNGDGSWDSNAWSNYCYRVVDRFKSPKIYWEIGPNEPYQSGPTYYLNVTIATNYAKALQAGIRGVTNADPTAKIIAIAGASGDGQWAWEVWTNLSAASQAAIGYVSTHIYPPDNGGDPNAPDTSTSNNPGDWITVFSGVRPVWNTESGTYGVGSIKSMNGIWQNAYDVYGTYSPEATRSERENRQTASTVRILTVALRCLGYGMEKYMYYDSRYFNDSSFVSVNPYPASYEQVDDPKNVTLSVMPHFIRKGFGRLANASTVNIEAYSFTNASGNPVVAAWNHDRTNRVITTTNSGFTVYDCMGNQVQTGLTTALLTRFPQYFVSTTLTLAQLSNTLAYASAVGTVDVLPPNISFDIAPSGSWSGQTNAQFVKWTALDDFWTAWTTTQTATNVLYKWKLDGGSYSAYSQSNHVWLSNLASGAHTIYVSAIDANGNTAEKSYEFTPSITPPAAASQLVVSGNLSVGTLNIGQ